MKTPVELDGYGHDHDEVCRRTTEALERAGRSGETLIFNVRAERAPGPDALIQVVRDYCDVSSHIGVVRVL